MEMLWTARYWAFHCNSFKHVEVRREKILEPYIGDKTRPTSLNNIGWIVSCSLQPNKESQWKEMFFYSGSDAL